jgi:hypothetical protein
LHVGFAEKSVPEASDTVTDSGRPEKVRVCCAELVPIPVDGKFVGGSTVCAETTCGTVRITTAAIQTHRRCIIIEANCFLIKHPPAKANVTE